MSRLSRLGSNLSQSSIIGNRDDEIRGVFTLEVDAFSDDVTVSAGDPVNVECLCTVGGDQTGLTLTISINWTGDWELDPATPDTVDLDGWTLDHWDKTHSMFGASATASLYRATHATGTSHLLFTCVSGAPGVDIVFGANIASDQIPGGVGDEVSGDGVTVTV